VRFDAREFGDLDAEPSIPFGFKAWPITDRDLGSGPEIAQ
jgi:hypothetical protein